MAPIDLRCSAIVFRKQAVLLIHRRHDGVDDWALPGGSPREGESMAACARREVREETGLSVDPERVAFVVEALGPRSRSRTVDLVFVGGELLPDQEPEQREPGLEPKFVPVDLVQSLDLRPPLAGHLRGLLDRGVKLYAPYLGNLWRPVDGNAARPQVPEGAIFAAELP